LDYFGVDTLGAVPVVAGAASARWWWWRKRAFAAAAGPSPTRRPWKEPPQREDARLEDTTLPQLALALLREIDDGRGFGDGGGGGGGDDEWYDAAAQAEDAELIRRLKEGSL
jgi:ABC-type glycerol-3-phosphate transport system substrate-binding protein